MARLRHAIVAGLLMWASLSSSAVADVQVCVDDQNSCPVVPGDALTTSDQTTSDQATSDQVTSNPTSLDQTTPDTRTVGPPVSVDPFAVPPTPTSAPQVGQPLVISPGTGSDQQHLPPGPPNFQIDP